MSIGVISTLHSQTSQLPAKFRPPPKTKNFSLAPKSTRAAVCQASAQCLQKTSLRSTESYN